MSHTSPVSAAHEGLEKSETTGTLNWSLTSAKIFKPLERPTP